MRIFQTIKNFITRGKYVMTKQTLVNIADHPKIVTTSAEIERIAENLRYYSGTFEDLKYTNTDGDVKKRKLNHLPIARTASKKIASLVFNEKAEITVSEQHANDFIQQTLENDRFIKNFERYLESCLALGGLAMRPYVDGDKVRISFIQAPVFFPLQTNTQDVSSAVVVVCSQRSENGKMCYYTLFEIHEWVDESNYTLTNELYRSTEFGIVGERVPLTYLYDDLKEVVYFTGLSRPIFTYLKPPGMNNKDIGSPLGLSIFDNAKTTIDFINKTFDEFMWEVRMGQRRIAVSDKLTEIRVREENGNITFKPRFDVEQNVFMRLGTHDAQNEDVTDLTTPIRSDDYIKAINEGLSLFEMQLGVSAGMFTFDGKSMKTATEIVSENSDTYQMRNSIATLVEQSLKELVISVLEVAKGSGLYDGQIPSMDGISINLDDGVFTDRNAELDYWMKMVTAGFAPKSMAIEKTLNVTKEEALKLEKEINGNVIGEVNNSRSDEDVEIYGN